MKQENADFDHVLQARPEEFLKSWLGEVASGRRPAANAGTTQRDARELLGALQDAIAGGRRPEPLDDAAWARVRSVLAALSQSRAAQGAERRRHQPLRHGDQEAAVRRPAAAARPAIRRPRSTAAWAASHAGRPLAQFTATTYQRSREEVIQRQQQELLELSTPVVKLWDGVLAVPMIGTLDSSRTQLVMESLLQRIVETGSELAIIDITGVPTVDTLVAQHLLKTVTAIRLMGADCIISGIRPQIAQTIVHLGIDLQGITTKATLADALSAGPEEGRLRRHAQQGLSAMERIPILKMGKALLVTIQVDLQDQLALALQDDLSAQIERTGANGVLIDISALEIVDSFVGRMLASISGIASVLDATTVVVGMQPAVAITLVELGLSLDGVRTALNVERGMALLAADDRNRN